MFGSANVIDIKVLAEDVASRVLQQVSGEINKLGSSANSNRGFLGNFGSALSNVFQTALGFITANVMTRIGSSIADFAHDVIIGGANLQRLQIATEVLGKNMGVSTDKVNDMVKALEKTNTFGTNAYNAINSLLRSGLLPMVENLTVLDKQSGKTQKGFDAFIYTVKDLASAMGVSSSEGIEVVTRALITQRDEALQGLGINVNLRREFDLFAGQTGRTADELSNMERSQIILNAVMKEGQKVSGTYFETYKTAGKNILSIQDAWESFKDLIGKALAPAIQTVTFALLELVKGLRDMVENNPQVTAFLQGLGQFFIDTFTSIGKTMSDIWTTLSPILTQLGDAIKSIFESFQQAGVSDTIKQVGTDIGNIAKQIVVDFVNNLKDAVVRFSEYLKSDDGRKWLENFKKTLEGIGVVLGIIIQFVGILINLLPKLLEKIQPVVEALYKLANLATLGTLDYNLQKAIEGYNNNQQLIDNAKKLEQQQKDNANNGIPNFAVGTNFVPNDMLAYIHKGEAIVPARYNTSNYMGGITVNISGAGDPEAVAMRVKEMLAREMQAQAFGLSPSY